LKPKQKETPKPYSTKHEGITIPWSILSQHIKPVDAVRYFIARYYKNDEGYALTTDINNQALIDDLLDKKYFISPSSDVIDKEFKNNKIELYNYHRGVYKPVGIHTIKRFCYNRVKSLITQRNFEIIIDYIKSYTRVSNEVLNSQSILTLTDCNYNWIEHESEPHDHEILNTVSSPVLWNNPNADVQPFQDFLEKVMLPEEIQTIYELIGYCLYYKNMTIRELFIFYGSHTACGKTVCANVITRLLGVENTNSATLSEMVTKQFSSSMMVGKMLNVCPEEEQGKLPTSKIKAWTGQDRTNSERKGVDEISSFTTAKFIVLSNHLPSFQTSEESIFTRINVLSFPNSFKNDMDDKLTDKLTTPEVLSGILHKSVEAFKTVEKTGKFSNWKPVETRETMIHTVSNSLRAFSDMFIERGEFDDIMTKHELHVMYTDNFCKIIGSEAKIIPKITCGKLLPKVLDYVDEGTQNKYDARGEKDGQERIWKYIKWKDTNTIQGAMRELLKSMGKEYPEDWEPLKGTSAYEPEPPKKNKDLGEFQTDDDCELQWDR